MSASFVQFFTVALLAALCSPLGGLVAILLKPSSLLLSLMAGLAGGVLLGAIAFEMLPQALDLSSLIETIAGFLVGVGLVYGFDLYVNRGAIAGPEAEQRPQVDRFHRRRKPRGDEVTVLAGGTSAEEVIEGIVIGVSATIAGGTAIIVGIAIALDNISEAMSIGEMIRNGKNGDERAQRRKTLKWTGLIGISLLGSALFGWFVLRAVPADWLGFLTAAGAGAIFYLSATDLLPEAESHQYQQSGGLAAAAGFLTMLVLTEFM